VYLGARVSMDILQKLARSGIIIKVKAPFVKHKSIFDEINGQNNIKSLSLSIFKPIFGKIS
jgi:hypothetical protein